MKRKVSLFLIVVATLIPAGWAALGAISEHRQHRPESALGYGLCVILVLLAGIIVAGLAPDENTF